MIEVGEGSAHLNFAALNRLQARIRPQRAQHFHTRGVRARGPRHRSAESGQFDRKRRRRPLPAIQRYDETVPPGRTTRAISATPLAGSGTKKSTSAITAASNRSVSKGNTMALP